MGKKPVFDPSDRAFKLSRTAIEEHVRCPRCFYQSRRLGFKRPSGPMSQLPTAVDGLLKREFDYYRERQEPHPVMRDLPGDLVPFSHPDLEEWRKNFTGLQLLHEPSGLVVTGAVDDIWIDRSSDVLFVVDYKTSSQRGEITDIYDSYKRQADIYQYLLRGQGFAVSDTAYFVMEQVDKEAVGFNHVLRFDVTVLPYLGDTAWVEGALLAARDCLDSDDVPQASDDCDLCAWVANVTS